jgi:hypothetical protein
MNDTAGDPGCLEQEGAEEEGETLVAEEGAVDGLLFVAG